MVVLIYDLSEFVKEVRKHEGVTSASFFSVPAELSSRYNSCSYHLLFFCDTSEQNPACQKGTSLERAACSMSDNGNFTAAQPNHSSWSSIPVVGLVVGAVVTAPKIPDAAIQMLKNRRDNHLQFTVGLLFLAGWIALMVLALRQESPQSLLWLAAVIVIGPYLLMAGFWVLQHVFDGAASGVDAAAAYLVSLIGLPGCIMMCTAHDAKEVAELVKAGRHVPKL